MLLGKSYRCLFEEKKGTSTELFPRDSKATAEIIIFSQLYIRILLDKVKYLGLPNTSNISWVKC